VAVANALGISPGEVTDLEFEAFDDAPWSEDRASASYAPWLDGADEDDDLDDLLTHARAERQAREFSQSKGMPPHRPDRPSQLARASRERKRRSRARARQRAEQEAAS